MKILPNQIMDIPLKPSPSVADGLKVLEEALHQAQREINALRQEWARVAEKQSGSLEEGQKTQLQKTVDDLKQAWQTDLRALEKTFQTERAQWMDQLKQKDAPVRKVAFLSKLWNYLNQPAI